MHVDCDISDRNARIVKYDFLNIAGLIRQHAAIVRGGGFLAAQGRRPEEQSPAGLLVEAAF